MNATLKPAAILFVLLTLLTGVAYPLAITGIAQLAFPKQANGSMFVVGDKTVGSELIAQGFTGDKYLWSRPSATSPSYNAAASSGSNLGPTNPALAEAVKQRADSLRKSTGATAAVPVDSVTASASGLDPHLTPAAAAFQVERIAKARGMATDQVRNVIAKWTEPRTLGILGEPRVNVLRVNLELDSMQ